jgi:hypothetical protein
MDCIWTIVYTHLTLFNIIILLFLKIFCIFAPNFNIYVL